ncbi:GNAT family N-acetyltransferase [Amycolatopsis sp. H20-H5]|uniref:GNAT family N-acetyltransferase n=1 Tax=Amycolatopsis sp. H20-H5 TaxID=3046309 RepID=UPI002DB73461|nr:GNAT family N-acetyltransferase [Amycolatopsis sp. H20-H5]MEC3973681.1 GNAT family N-acetyltransferase [Amycolatopsis sp. H20-H5]
MEEIISYLEITALSELRPAKVKSGLTLEPVDAGSPLIRELHTRIGTPYSWPGVTRSDEDWAGWLALPRCYRLVKYRKEVAGIADFEPQQDGEVEITTFGLLPEYIGRGLGGHALTLAVEQAWQVEPLGGEPLRRVWLHTSTRDHPNALTNYLRRGFRPFQTR